jgi:hypothetical protein
MFDSAHNCFLANIVSAEVQQRIPNSRSGERPHLRYRWLASLEDFEIGRLKAASPKQLVRIVDFVLRRAADFPELTTVTEGPADGTRYQL